MLGHRSSKLIIWNKTFLAIKTRQASFLNQRSRPSELDASNPSHFTIAIRPSSSHSSQLPTSSHPRTLQTIISLRTSSHQLPSPHTPSHHHPLNHPSNPPSPLPPTPPNPPSPPPSPRHPKQTHPLPDSTAHCPQSRLQHSTHSLPSISTS